MSKCTFLNCTREAVGEPAPDGVHLCAWHIGRRKKLVDSVIANKRDAVDRLWNFEGKARVGLRHAH